MAEPSPYIHALRFRWPTGAYDRLVAATLPEGVLKRRLVAQAGLAPGQRILDLGCGTGTLTLLIKETVPAAEVFGLAGDEDVLAIAREKVARAGVDVTLVRGLAQEAALPAGSFDHPGAVEPVLPSHATRGQGERPAAGARPPAPWRRVARPRLGARPGPADARR